VWVAEGHVSAKCVGCGIEFEGDVGGLELWGGVGKVCCQ
jgi:hypothetical protein